MFIELLPVLKDRAVTITLALEGEFIRINVIPQKLGKRQDGDDDLPKSSKRYDSEPQILTEPFTAVATAAELDAELPALLVQYAEIRTGTAATIADLKSKSEEAIEAVKKETKKDEAAATKKNDEAKKKLVAAKKKVGEKDAPETGSLFGADAKADKPESEDDEKDEEGEE